MKILKCGKYIIKKLTFILFLLFTFSMGIKTLSAQKKFTIVLDAGHGGKDYGASRGGYIEKKIALSLALKTGEILKREKGLDVIFTRKKDVFIELHNRARIANEKNADLFVSIHCNANNSSKPHGAETYVLGLRGNKENFEIVKKENEVILLEDDYKKNYDYDPNSPETVIALSVLQEENLDLSLAFGGFVQSNFRGIKRFDRKVKQANFLVLRETVMPSVLIELGFISNKIEGKFLNSRSGQYKMAKAIASAIEKYVKRIRINSVKELPNISETTKKTKKEIIRNDSIKKEILKSPPKKIKVENQNKDTQSELIKVENKIYFSVQIAASKTKIENKDLFFKGLGEVKALFIDGYYKYYFGETVSFQEVKNFQSKVRKLGYDGAFVVAFRGNKKITLKEALNSL